MTRAPRTNAPAALAALACALALPLAACHGSGDSHAQPAPPATATAAAASDAPSRKNQMAKHGTVRFDTERGAWIIDVEIARTEEEHARGLMFRRDLAPDHGMIFVFDESAVQRFWMHNTYLRLDMLFLGDDRGVVGVVENAEPLTDTGRSVGKPSRYVLEVAGGEAAAHAVGPGTRAQFINVEE